MSVEKKVPEIRFKGFTGEWEENILGDQMTVTSVKRILQSDWTQSGVRFLRARDIVSAYKNESPSDYLYISREKYNEYSQLSGKVKIGDLLVTGVGTIGVPLLITNNEPVYFKDGNIIWFKNENKIDGMFLFYSFTSEQIQTHIKHSAGIGTVGTYTINSGKNTPIQLPTREEQAAIGNYFQKLDILINQHQQKYDKLSTFKKAMLEKMFPKQGETEPEIRFKGFSGEWKEKNLSSIATNISDGDWIESNHIFNSGKYRIIQTGNIGVGEFFDKPMHAKFFNQYDFDKIKANEIYAGDILISRLAEPAGRTVILPETGFKMVTAVDVTIIRPEDGFNSYFLMTKLNTDESLKAVSEGVSGTSHKRISRANLVKIMITLPSIEEQTAIGNYFQKLDALINQHQQQITKLNNIKQACLSKMFV
ncbi:restriction endonuclease subunit S [Moellerella wisconsensis]|uniref:restriction endonuclease subunit S n=1 Tax=Moellerella wisconsensis TaxID=158849 RepID=UPI003076275D